jgi:hypothetical protein
LFLEFKIQHEMKIFFASIYFLLLTGSIPAQENRVLLEAENFQRKGGWVVDQQFMDLMGSSYLMAHGMGVPVVDAETTAEFPTTGEYSVFVHTFNWTSPWFDGEGPGKFQLLVNGEKTGSVLGVSGSRWMWQYAGKVNITNKSNRIALHDLTGFNGRVDAIYFTKDSKPPPAEMDKLAKFRKNSWVYPKNLKKLVTSTWLWWVEVLPERLLQFQQPDWVYRSL